MKKTIIIAGTLGLLLFLVFLSQTNFIKGIPKSTEPTPEVSSGSEHSNNSGGEIEEITFSEEDLIKYKEITLKDGFVLHVRTALNGYLDGSNTGMIAHEVVISPSNNDDNTSGLGSFDKEYYKSKFVVMAIDDALFGGANVSIIFQNRPDKVFTAWVYNLADGGYDLRGFWQDTNFTTDTMYNVQKVYKKYLTDPEMGI